MAIVTDPEAAERMARRYPQPSSSRLWVFLAIALAAAGLTWLIFAGAHWATGVPTARVDAFTISSDTQVRVTLTVDRPDPRLPAKCLLYAQAVSYDRVGELYVPVPAGGNRLTQLQVVLKTFKRATTAVVGSCQTSP